MKEHTLGTSVTSPIGLLRTISTGYWSSKALSTAIEIGFFSVIKDRECRLEELAEELNVSQRGLEVLFRFLQTAGLVVRVGENKVAASPVARQFLDPTQDIYLGFEATVSTDVWKAFESLTDKVIRGQNANATTYFGSLNEGQSKGFFETMHVQGQASVEEFAVNIDMQGCNTLVDVGCGPGTYSMALLRQYSRLHVVLIDLPDVIKRTKAKMIEANLVERVSFIEGNFWEVLPQVEYDSLLFSRIFHDWSDEQCYALLSRFCRQLKTNGMIIVHEEIIHDIVNPEWWPVMLDLFLFCLLGSGKTRTVDDLKAILQKVDCRTKDVYRLDEFTSVIVASKCTSS